jgi:hypothetical protein
MKLRSPLLGFLGLLCLGLIAMSLLRGNLDLVDAGERTAALFGVLFAIDRFALPLIWGLLTREG